MPKRPENMTPEERLTRIRSLERKAPRLATELAWAEQEREGTLKWGQAAFAENRRLTDRLQKLIERIPSIIEPDNCICPMMAPGDGQKCRIHGSMPASLQGGRTSEGAE